MKRMETRNRETLSDDAFRAMVWQSVFVGLLLFWSAIGYLIWRAF